MNAHAQNAFEMQNGLLKCVFSSVAQAVDLWAGSAAAAALRRWRAGVTQQRERRADKAAAASLYDVILRRSALRTW